MRCLIYAQGGGWGHLTRSARLARSLAVWKPAIFTNSPYAHCIPEVENAPAFDPSACDVLGDVLIVDTFPRGLAGELKELLPSLPALKVLVHRDLNARYVEWGRLREFVSRHYDLVLCPGEDGPLSDLRQSVHTEPWVHEARPRGSADAVVCAGGNDDELAWYGTVTSKLAAQAAVCCIAPKLPPGCPENLWVRHWPAIDYMATARVVVGGAGYNTVHEARACGVPLVAHPWPRKYDRQQLRARRFATALVETPEQAVDAVMAILRHCDPAPSIANRGRFDGADEAAGHITRMWNVRAGGNAQAKALPYSASKRPQAFSACGSL